MNSKNPKLHFLHEKLKEIDELKCLLENNGHENPTFLHKCVMYTREYPFLNEYIDECLSESKYDVNFQDRYGTTALMYASSYSSSDSMDETIDILLKYKANVNLQDDLGYTALMYSIIHFRLWSTEETIKKLIEHNTNLNIQDKNGMTVLMLVACDLEYPNDKIIKMLLNNKVDVNILNNKGSSALKHAVESSYFHGSYKTIKILLNWNADIKSAIVFAFENIKTNKRVINVLLPNRINLLKT